ncbi:MAG: hypothetical protein WBD40_10915 [Tepidisphaeraceae bacterium]
MKRFVQRDWRNVTIGLLVGLCLALTFGAAGDGGERYRLHVWSIDPAGGASDRGAYRIDTATGDVYQIDSGGSATRLNFPG